MVGKKKTWNKKKLNLKIGYCSVCNKIHYNTSSGWIINAEKKVFCEDHKEDSISCFDKYLTNQKTQTKSVMDW
jgi:hypothetical protein